MYITGYGMQIGKGNLSERLSYRYCFCTQSFTEVFELFIICRNC